jgi:AmmeMemoRadiSam system protein B
MSHLDKPELRNVNVQRTVYQGEQVFLIQDPLKLTEAAILLPQALGPLALLCDGQHTIPEIKAALEVRFGLRLPQEIIESLLEQFDRALLLKTETFDQAQQQALAEYYAAPHRPPALAGPSYPADPEALRQMLHGYMNGLNGTPPSPAGTRGIISPHLEYQRAVRQAELVIIFGTDHNGSQGTLTLTRQNYASPLGVMPTDLELVDRLAEVLGPENAFAEELHHRGEHSIELALVWLQYLRNGEPCPTLPVLCGSFHHFMAGQADIETETRFKAFVDVLKAEIGQRRTVVIAAGDLAHLGPAFDGPPLDAIAQAQMKVDDEALMDSLCRGDATEFFKFMQTGQYQRNVCGLSSFYFTLSVLDQTQGQTIAYDRCPADHNNASFVSVCGIVLE